MKTVLAVCSDCLALAEYGRDEFVSNANGGDDSETVRLDIAGRFSFYTDDLLFVGAVDSAPFFSWRSCPTCNRPLGSTRHETVWQVVDPSIDRNGRIEQ